MENMFSIQKILWQKRKQLVYFDHQNVKSLCLCHHYVNSSFQLGVFLLRFNPLILKNAICGTKYPQGKGVLPIMAYMARLCLKGVPFSGFRYIKGKGFHKLRYTCIKGQRNRSFRYLKGTLIIIFRYPTSNIFQMEFYYVLSLSL